jgi:hypothetical protein
MYNEFKEVFMSRSIRIVSIVLFFAVTSLGFAAEGASTRAKNKIGITWGLFDSAFPTIGSWGLHYNLNSSIRLTAGYGSFTYAPLTGIAPVSVKSYGVSAKLFLLKWWFAPYVGANYSRTSANGTFQVSGESITSSGALNSVMADFGLDFQAPIGLNFGFGAHYVLSPTVIKDVLPVVPTFYFGWYF